MIVGWLDWIDDDDDDECVFEVDFGFCYLKVKLID